MQAIYSIVLNLNKQEEESHYKGSKKFDMYIKNSDMVISEFFSFYLKTDALILPSSHTVFNGKEIGDPLSEINIIGLYFNLKTWIGKYNINY